MNWADWGYGSTGWSRSWAGLIGLHPHIRFFQSPILQKEMEQTRFRVVLEKWNKKCMQNIFLSKVK